MNKGTAAAAIARLVVAGLITAEASKGAVTRYYIRTSDELSKLSENRAQSNNGEVSQSRAQVSETRAHHCLKRGHKSISTEGDPRSSSNIPSDYKPIVDSYNEILGGKRGWTLARTFTESLAKALPAAFDEWTETDLVEVFQAVAEGKVNGHAPDRRNLTSLVWACVYGKIKIRVSPRTHPSPGELARLRRANIKEEVECA